MLLRALLGSREWMSLFLTANASSYILAKLQFANDIFTCISYIKDSSAFPQHPAVTSAVSFALAVWLFRRQ